MYAWYTTHRDRRSHYTVTVAIKASSATCKWPHCLDPKWRDLGRLIVLSRTVMREARETRDSLVCTSCIMKERTRFSIKRIPCIVLNFEYHMLIQELIERIRAEDLRYSTRHVYGSWCVSVHFSKLQPFNNTTC